MPLALVTGGSGFLGRNLVPFLISSGYTVRALFRSQDAKERILGALEEGQAPRLLLFACDLFDLAALKQGMQASNQGADVVFHCAAKAALGGPYAEFERDNVVGTQNVLWAAQSSGVRRLVFVSSEATCIRARPWGWLAPMYGIDEREPQAPPAWAPYSRTKMLAEQAVRAANSREGGLETVVVRPHRLWGRGDTVILAALLGACRAGMWRWFSPPATTTTTHVRNACAALLLAAQRGQPGEVYFVTDGEVLDLRDFFTRYIQAADPELHIPQATLPFWLAWLAATVRESLPPWLSGWVGPRELSRQALAVMGRSVVVRDGKIRRELGFENVISVVEGLAGVRQGRPGAAQHVDGQGQR